MKIIKESFLNLFSVVSLFRNLDYANKKIKRI